LKRKVWREHTGMGTVQRAWMGILAGVWGDTRVALRIHPEKDVYKKKR